MSQQTPVRAPGWQVAQVAGVPVFVARSWLVIAAVVIAWFGPQLAQARPDLGLLAYAVAGLYAIALFVSVLLHELAHAVVAGRVGLPATHIVINLWGGHTQFETEATTPWRSSLVAAVGPLSNGVVAVAALLVQPLLDADGIASRLVLALAVTNGLMALFNLVPGLPLDGGRLLEAVVWRITGDRSSGTLAAGWVGRGLAVLVVLVALSPFLLGRPPVLELIVWAALVGPLLWTSATAAIASARFRRRAQQLSVGRLLRPAASVPLDAVVADVVGVLPSADSKDPGLVWVVARDGRVVGVLDPRALTSVPPDRRPLVTVGSVATAHDPRGVLPAHLVGDELVTALRAAPGDVFAVLDQGRVVGTLHAADVVAALSGART